MLPPVVEETLEEELAALLLEPVLPALDEELTALLLEAVLPGVEEAALDTALLVDAVVPGVVEAALDTVEVEGLKSSPSSMQLKFVFAWPYRTAFALDRATSHCPSSNILQ